MWKSNLMASRYLNALRKATLGACPISSSMSCEPPGSTGSGTRVDSCQQKEGFPGRVHWGTTWHQGHRAPPAGLWATSGKPCAEARGASMGPRVLGTHCGKSCFQPTSSRDREAGPPLALLKLEGGRGAPLSRKTWCDTFPRVATSGERWCLHLGP